MKLMNFPPIHRGRGPQSLKKIPLQECMQLKLKNKVSGKDQILNDVNCTREVLALINCIESSDITSKCSEELTALGRCHKNYYNKEQEVKKANVADKLIPGVEKYTASQLNKLFKMYEI